jgi:hypothetical protein
MSLMVVRGVCGFGGAGDHCVAGSIAVDLVPRVTGPAAPLLIPS